MGRPPGPVEFDKVAYQREYMAARRARLKAGICPTCTKRKAVKGRVTCRLCLDAANVRAGGQA